MCQDSFLHNVVEGRKDTLPNVAFQWWVEVRNDSAHEVQERGSDGWVGLHGVMHDQDSWLYVHNTILFWAEEQPVIKQSQLGIGGSNVGRACCQEPANDGPPGQDIRTQHFVRGVDYPTDVSNEVTAQRLTVRG